jgi:glycosyltransferase involved in cell wall biosynthesis
MRILHVTPYAAAAWGYGGIPRIVGALTRELVRHGHEVTVCATDVHSADRRLSRLEPGSHEGVRQQIFPNQSNRLAYRWQFFTPIGMHAYLRDHAHEFDIAHLHACRNLPGAIAAHYLDRYGVPYVLAPNGTAPVIERRRLAKRVFDALAGTRILRRAAAVIAVSEAERIQLHALGVEDSRIRVLPNPVELAEFQAAVTRGAFRRRRGLGDRTLIAFLGKITPRKRLEVLVRAFARLDQGGHLVLAGNDMGGLEPALALAGRLGVVSRVTVTGLVEGHARLELLADADLVVYPGQDEIFGLVPLEAILAGTPVIVSSDSGCGDLIRKVGGGVAVPAGDDRVLAHAIATVITSRDEWRRAATAAAERVRAEFAPASIATALAGVYAGVLEAARTQSAIETAPASAAGVSFAVPVKNGGATIARTIAGIEGQADGRPTEIIVVDDRSQDDSRDWLRDAAAAGRVRLLNGAGRGVSAALNLGIREARYPIICQVDQDVELLPGWMSRLVAALERDRGLGAIEGQYTVNPRDGIVSRVMALDLEQRYESLAAGSTDHVCTGNTAFRAEALHQAGGFDESLGYGNDNDMSLRLRRAGWRLAHCRQARSFHSWRDSFAGYWRQQYGFGYGRLDVVARAGGRVTGDRVAPWPMMLHPIAMAIAICALVVGAGLSAAGSTGRPAVMFGLALVVLLAAERALAGLRALWRFGDRAALFFPVLHLIRDAAWVSAIAAWSWHRVLGRAPSAHDSMRPRAPVASVGAPEPAGFIPRPARTVCVIPAHNEAATLGHVLADVRDCHPALDLLVVDDGSADESVSIVERAGVRSLRLPERMGVGHAMRAGLRYARRLGYDSAIRLDADGQHQAGDIERLLAPLNDGRADVVLGSRYLEAPADGTRLVRAARRALAASLSMLIGRTVTDPTSGFCALGPRAMKLLADDHPTGYPEPEMWLMFSRHELTVLEIPVASRPRLGGRTSLTFGRLAAASARVLLAMLIVPLRRGGGGGDGA